MTMNTLNVINPFNLEVIKQVDLEGQSEIEQKIQACAKQYQYSLSVEKRKLGLVRWAALIEQQKTKLAKLITLEQGKTLTEALGEVDYALSYIYYYQSLIDESFFAAKRTSKGVYESYRSIGVCAFITPWNFPVAMLIRKAAPAIAAGNTVIAKPSEFTPLSAQIVQNLCQQAFGKEGVFELCVCDASLFSRIVMKDHRVRKVSFTGSTKVGKLLIEQSAYDIKRLSLELGGNAPCIVSKHANIEQAVQGIIHAKFRNAGQTCVAINHLYVHKDIEHALLKALSQEIQTLCTGNGLAVKTDIGPMIHQSALEEKNKWVEQALAHGAQIVCTGVNLNSNVCMTPMLVKNVPKESALNKNELFAPVLVSSAFCNLNELIHEINASPMGLAAYLFSHNEMEIKQCEQNIATGMLGVNTGVISNAKAPFGGVKHSGFGREGATAGIQEFTSIHYSARL